MVTEVIITTTIKRLQVKNVHITLLYSEIIRFFPQKYKVHANKLMCIVPTQQPLTQIYNSSVNHRPSVKCGYADKDVERAKYKYCKDYLM